MFKDVIGIKDFSKFNVMVWGTSLKVETRQKGFFDPDLKLSAVEEVDARFIQSDGQWEGTMGEYWSSWEGKGYVLAIRAR